MQLSIADYQEIVKAIFLEAKCEMCNEGQITTFHCSRKIKFQLGFESKNIIFGMTNCKRKRQFKKISIYGSVTKN